MSFLKWSWVSPLSCFHSSTSTTVSFVLKNPSRPIKWLLIEFFIKEGNWDANQALGDDWGNPHAQSPTCKEGKVKETPVKKCFQRELKKKISIQEIGNIFLFLKEVSIVYVQLFPNILLEVSKFLKIFNSFNLETKVRSFELWQDFWWKHLEKQGFMFYFPDLMSFCISEQTFKSWK